MNIHPNHEITNHYADTTYLPTDVPEVLITAEASEESHVETGGEEPVDTSLVGVPELREQTEPNMAPISRLSTTNASQERSEEVTAQTLQPSLAQTAGEVAISELVDEPSSEGGSEQIEDSSESSETASLDYFAEVTNDLGDEPESEPNSEIEQNIQENDSPEPLSGGGGGDDLDPPDDTSGGGTAEGGEDPDRASEPISADSTKAVWDMGKILIDAKGQSGPFPIDTGDGNIVYDDTFPGMRSYDFPSEVVTEAGYPEGTTITMHETPTHILDPDTETYEVYDPQVHPVPPGEDDIQHLMQIGIVSQDEGVVYSRTVTIEMDPDGGLDFNFTQRSGPIGGREEGAPNKPFSEYTQQEMDDFIEMGKEYAQSVQDEGDFHGFSETDAARVLRLIGLAILRDQP